MNPACHRAGGELRVPNRSLLPQGSRARALEAPALHDDASEPERGGALWGAVPVERGAPLTPESARGDARVERPNSGARPGSSPPSAIRQHAPLPAYTEGEPEAR